MQISTFDKNLLTFTLSLLLLAALIFGIVFATEENNNQANHIQLEVTLSKKINFEENKDAKLLAQNNQAGSGESENTTTPQSNITGIALDADGTSINEQLFKQSQHKNTHKLKTIVTNNSKERTQLQKNTIKSSVDRSQSEQNLQLQTLAKIENSITERIESYLKRPKSKYISASTKSYEFANYMHLWVKKIERVSNLNYPKEAKIRDFIGSLIMTVGITSNGEVDSVNIVKSSGYKAIDDAAKHLVQISGPYEPLPNNQNNIDVLYITRTWQFLPGNKLKNL